MTTTRLTLTVVSVLLMAIGAEAADFRMAATTPEFLRMLAEYGQ